jgi:DNA-directed RNA polymerase
MQNLNATNEIILAEYAQMQVHAESLQTCATLDMEAEYLYLRGIIGNADNKGGVFLPQMATQLMGNMIARVQDVTEERTITVYPQEHKGKAPTQSLNASLKMVALYSTLMNGYTNAQTIAEALKNWIEEDSINEELDLEALSIELVTNLINAQILNSDTGRAIMDTGAHYEAYGVQDNINDLRLLTMRNLWKRAQPRMQPMKHKITWTRTSKGNAVCEIKNLMLIKGKSIVSNAFIRAANKASNVGYMLNNAIREELRLWLESGEMPDMPEDEQEAMKAINAHEDKCTIIEHLLLLPVNSVMYFPHTADWRGRFYARGGLTQFQSIKACKAIFDFAESVRVDNPTGLYLHVANAHGMDKVSINKRVEWVKDNIKEITEGGLCNDIYAKRSALALCEYMATGETNVICHIDGTCNGTQWTAVMFRDAKTGKLVNVCSSTLDDNPHDLYGVIADRASKLAQGKEKGVLLKYARDLTKNPIMTLGYGASELTLVAQMEEYLSAKGEIVSAKKIIKLVMTAIKLEAPALTKLTANLKRILKAKPRTQVTWKAQDLEVVAEQNNTDHLNLYGTSYTGKLKQTSELTPLQIKQSTDALARGISPNYVHSFDSAHLRAVVLASVVGLSCIHDSIGCPANMVMETNQIIRTEFYNINKQDLIANIYEALNESYTPQMGKLNLSEVLEATYIFS